MNIVVCIKRVISTDCSIKAEGGVIKERGLHYVVNPYDLAAVEEAVRLKGSNKDSEITIICVGPPEAEKSLRSCLAIGGEKGIMVWDADFNGLDSHATATVLARAIQRQAYDLVLCGQRAADTEGGQVGAILAGLLNIPIVSAVVKLSVSPDQRKVEVHRKLEKGNREVVEADLPVLITVETGLNRPRYPSLRAVLAAKRKEIARYDLKALNLDLEQAGAKTPRTEVQAYSPPKPRVKKFLALPSDVSAEERLRLLVSGGVTQKKSDFLEGKPDNVAAALVQFLEKEKLLG